MGATIKNNQNIIGYSLPLKQQILVKNYNPELDTTTTIFHANFKIYNFRSLYYLNILFQIVLIIFLGDYSIYRL